MFHEEWLDNLSAVVLGTSDVTRLENDIIELLQAKYDIIRHKVLEEALKDQIGLCMHKAYMKFLSLDYEF